MSRKIFVAVVSAVALGVIAYQQIEISRLRRLKGEELVKAIALADIILGPSRSYASLCVDTADQLPEPDIELGKDIISRIDMLQQHVEFKPSPKWVGDVIASARREIESLRSEIKGKKGRE